MNITRFAVPGIPVQQGSKKHVGNGIMIESAKNLRPWRDSVTYAAREALPLNEDYATGPLSVSLIFWFPRPKAHYRADGSLRDTALNWKSTTPDIDKLARAALDAITASGMWRDDAQVAELILSKRYTVSPDNFIGMSVSLWSLR